MAATGAPWPAAVGVSGGSDSLALMFLLGDWAARSGRPPPVVLCVDHGLRPQSRAEARRVARWARAAGLEAHVLTHRGRPAPSDIEAAARRARYRLMGAWLRRKGLEALYVAHTRDDQAETFLLRLARGSGVDGLSAMRAVAPYPEPEFAGMRLVRPLLDFDRQALRDELVGRGHAWIDDPMNSDPRFARVRIREAWRQLEALGLSKSRIADAARHLGRARAALEAASRAVLARACRPCGNGVLVDAHALAAAPRELGLRALATVLMAVSRSPYRPRFERLETLFDSIREGSLGAGRTLHGCRIAPAAKRRAVFGRATLLVQREKSRHSAGKSGL